MKLTLILLISFCTFVVPHAQVIPSETDIDLKSEFRGGGEILENTVEFINESVVKILNKVYEIIDKIEEGNNSVVSDALEKAMEIVKKITEIAKKGIAALVCAKPYKSRITELMKQVQSGLYVCTAESRKEIKIAEQAVMDVIREIEGYAIELYDMVKECFDNDGNIIGGTLCVAKKAFIIKDKVNAAVELAEATIIETKEKAKEIGLNLQECVVISTEEPITEINFIMWRILYCVAASTSDQTEI